MRGRETYGAGGKDKGEVGVKRVEMGIWEEVAAASEWLF